MQDLIWEFCAMDEDHERRMYYRRQAQIWIPIGLVALGYGVYVLIQDQSNFWAIVGLVASVALLGSAAQYWRRSLR
jgi:ABC-type uncharacterized transport system permease subunit